MKSSAICEIALALTLLAASTAHATGTVAYVDYSRLVQEAPQSEASTVMLRKEFSAQRTKVEKDAQEVESLKTRYKNLGPATNPFKRAAVSEGLEKAQKNLRSDEQTYRTALHLRRDQLAASLRNLLKQEIKAYARKHGFSVILGSEVAFAARSVDITEAILTRLKLAYKVAQEKTAKQP